MIVSASTIAAAGRSTPGWHAADLEIRGRSEPVAAFLIFDREELASVALTASS
jgi:hypothetical protein